jgi:acyl carrier protein
MERSRILAIVLEAMAQANRSRVPEQQLDASPDAAIFGAPSPLDSLGLVALLIDIEEAFDRAGHPIVLSDERAMSQARSPFRSVSSLTDYIELLIAQAGPTGPDRR